MGRETWMRGARGVFAWSVLGGLFACAGDPDADGSDTATGSGDGDGDGDGNGDGDGDGDGVGDGDGDGDGSGDGDGDGDGETTVVTPEGIDDILYNPGMGFTDSHFSWGDVANPPPYPDPSDYPPSTVAYFRWHWSEIEPVRGEIDFELFDTVIDSAAARSEGERLSFRIMTVQEGGLGVPTWLTQAPYSVPGVDSDGTFVPDYRDATFLDELDRLMSELGAHYDGHPGIDSLDIGTVGCWGEWNTACLAGGPSWCALYGLAEDDCDSLGDAFEEIIDIHEQTFPNTPRLMLGGESGVNLDALVRATQGGSGWRVDCLGDWGFWGPNWNHMEDLYPAMIANATAADPSFPEVFQGAPIHLEVCGTITDWQDVHGYTVQQVQDTFDWALAQHASVINGKSVAIPAAYWPVVDDFLTKVGYRLVIQQLEHDATVAPGGALAISTLWRNDGVAPPYSAYPVVFRLRDDDDTVVTTATSAADLRTFLPGEHGVDDALEVPADLAPGSYALELAVLDVAGDVPTVHLAIAGERPDGWVPLSTVEVE